MELAHLLSSNGTALLKSFQIDDTVSNAGIPLLIDTAGEAGLNLATTTSAANMVGVNLDTVTYTTTQGIGANSAERKVRVIVNPDAVYRTRLSGGAAEDTALALQTETTGDTDGTVVTTGAEWSSPTYDEGVVWGFSGANPSQVRKVTSVSSTAGTVTIPFDNDIAVGDEYLRAPYWYNATTAVQLTTNLTQANAAIAVGTGAEFRVLDMDLGDQGAEGRTKSNIYMISRDHVYSGRPT